MVDVQRWNGQLKERPESEWSNSLFIENHPDYPAYLLVNSFDPLYAHSLKDVIGEYRAVHKLKLDDLLKTAETNGYNSVFYMRDPEELYGFLDHLDDPYPYDLNVELKKFQLRGYNYLRGLDSKIYNWSTGTGKSVVAVAEANYLLKSGEVDKVVVLSKSHNKINWQRQFKKVASLEATVAEGKGSNPQNRRLDRSDVYHSEDIFIINYEKMRFRPETPNGDKKKLTPNGYRKSPAPSGDGQELLEALKNRRVLWIWDEMPTKMGSMQTGWYKGAQRLLRATSHNYQIELTAKKVQRDPENVYSCTKILNSTVWPSKGVFRSLYAKRMSTWNRWEVAVWDVEKLTELGMRLAHFTHVADKYTDPDIRNEFPQDHWEDVIIDMSDADRKLYDAAKTAVLEDAKTGEKIPVRSRVLPLQLICNNPLLLGQSESKIAQAVAKQYKLTDKNCAKLETLKDLLEEIEGKVVLFTMFNEYGTKMLAPYLAQWGHQFVLYTGKQEEQDRFREDARVKIFLSSDMGSDSIDLEQATTVINYDLPWNHSTLIQRVNRISRLTSQAEHVFYYNLIVADSVEEKKMALLEKKRQYEEAIDTDILEQSDLLTTDLDDIRFLLS
jgi:SNF2 family DNA or RNA helicase